MKIIKIYSSWNQLKLKARVGHYNTEAHVRILGRGEGGHSSKTEKATQNIHWRKMCPRPLVWCEPGTGQAGAQWLGYQCLHQECVSNSNNHNYNTSTITTIAWPAPSSEWQTSSGESWPEAASAWCPGGDGIISGQCSVRPDWVSLFVQGISDKSLAVRDIRALLSDVTRSCDARCDQGAGGGAAGVSGGLSGIILVTIVMTWDKYAATMADDNDTPHCFTQMNSICWSITQPQHVINFQSWRLVYSRTQYWHTQLHFQFLLVFLGLLKLLLTQMMKLRCHDSILWDDYCYYN